MEEPAGLPKASQDTRSTPLGNTEEPHASATSEVPEEIAVPGIGAENVYTPTTLDSERSIPSLGDIKSTPVPSLIEQLCEEEGKQERCSMAESADCVSSRIHHVAHQERIRSTGFAAYL